MKNKSIILLLFACVLSAHAQKTLSESNYYALKTIPIPEKIKLEVGGLATLPDGRLAASTRRGEIWVIENPYMIGGSQPHYSRYASGQHELLGLAWRDGSFYATQRGELTKFTDRDGDGTADAFESVYRFDLSGNYHEYAYGPVFDKNGDMLVTLNVAWVGYGEGLAKWHGWLLKVKADGSMEPIATGLRSPAGFTVNSAGDVFYAENQGDWVGSGRVTHLEKGDFAGNAGGLNWTKEPESPLRLTKKDLAVVDNGQPMSEAVKTIKELKLPCVWFPHGLMGISTADILEDTTRGAFGPFAGQYFVTDQGHSKIMRMTLEKIDGEYQGACYPFHEGWASGLLRICWGRDGSMFGGMTSRGWASTGKEEYALQRLVWTGETPFEIKDISARPDGFELRFTLPVDPKSAQNAANYAFNSFNYKYHHHYGSPVIGQGTCPLRGIVVSDDGLRVRVVLDSLRAGYIHEVQLNDFKSADGMALLHNTAYYTLNRIPAGEKTVLTEAQRIKAAAPVTAMSGHEHLKMGGKKSKKKSKIASVSTLKRQIVQPADWGQPDEVIRLGTLPGLKYDKTELQVKAGAKVKLVFHNNDDMQHNIVITTPGAANETGEKAMKLGLKGPDMQYVPNSNKVLVHSNILEPGQTETLFFVAPSVPGIYQFVCTYPGHYAAMQGVLRVTD
jgi:uncharacterized cupredoxin-like copper-binding protein